MKSIRMQVIKCSILLWIVLLITGCIVYQEPYPYRPHYDVSTTGTTIVHSDIEWVVWEYYDWDYDIVVHLHSLNHDPDDVSMILFLAYYGHTDPFIIARWRQSRISWFDIITVHLKLEPDIVFVHIAQDTHLGPPYNRPYGYYWKNQRNIVLTDVEIINLVHLRVISEAYRVPPVEVIRWHEDGHNFDRIVRREHEEGRSIRTRKGRVIKEQPPERRRFENKPPRDNQPDRPGRDNYDKPDKDKPDKDKTHQDKPDKPDNDKPGKDKTDRDKPDKDKSDKDKPDKSKKDK